MEFTIGDGYLRSPVVRWFAPPVLPTGERTRRARLFWKTAWAFFAVVAVILSIAVAIEPETLSRRAVTITAVGLLVAGLHELNRRGRTSIASWTFVLGLTLIVTQRAWNTGGIHAPVGVFYTMFIVMAGAMIGARAGIITAITCVVGALFLTISELVGWLPSASDGRHTAAAFVFVLLTIGLTFVLQSLLTRTPPRAHGEDFVQMLVHDMRAPLMVLSAQLGMARETVTGDAAERIDEAIGGVKTLNRMAGDLLDVGKFQGARMPLDRSPTNLAELSRGVVRGMRTIAPRRIMTVTSNGLATCNCDPALMRRLIENLVGNAVKHTPDNGRIRISVDGFPDGLRLAVQDEGPGIPASERRRVFEAFGSAGMRTQTGYDSTGLGLAFCKLTVESHGGTIRVEPAVPRGSIFVVELPVGSVGHAEST